MATIHELHPGEVELGDAVITCSYIFSTGLMGERIVLTGAVFNSGGKGYTVHISAMKVYTNGKFAERSELIEAYEDTYYSATAAVGVYEAKILEFRNRYKK